MKYIHVSTAAVLLFWGVALGLIFVPANMLNAWGIDAAQDVTFMGRRFAAAFVGLGLLCLLSRNLPPSKERRIIAFGIIAVLGCLSVLGVWEFLSGVAGAGILPAAAVEMAFAAAYYYVVRKLQ